MVSGPAPLALFNLLAPQDKTLHFPSFKNLKLRNGNKVREERGSGSSLLGLRRALHWVAGLVVAVYKTCSDTRSTIVLCIRCLWRSSDFRMESGTGHTSKNTATELALDKYLWKKGKYQPHSTGGTQTHLSVSQT